MYRVLGFFEHTSSLPSSIGAYSSIDSGACSSICLAKFFVLFREVACKIY